jgi:hypothetical protein
MPSPQKVTSINVGSQTQTYVSDPSFFRMLGSADQEMAALIAALEQVGATSVVTISSQSAVSIPLVAAFMTTLVTARSPVQVVKSVWFTSSEDTAANTLTTKLDRFTASQTSIVFVVLCDYADSTLVLEVAAGLGFNSNASYLWTGSTQAIHANLMRGSGAFPGMLGVRPSIDLSSAQGIAPFDISDWLLEFVDYWRRLASPTAPSALNSSCLSDGAMSRSNRTYGSYILNHVFPGHTDANAPTCASVPIGSMSAEVQEANVMLESVTGRWGVMDPRAAFVLDAVFMVAWHKAVRELGTADLSSLSFMGASGNVSFQAGARINVVFDIVNVQLVERNSIALKVVGRWPDAARSSMDVDTAAGPMFGPSGALSASFLDALSRSKPSTVTSTSSPAPSDGPCTDCELVVVLAVFLGVLIFVFVVGLMLIRGRRRLDASLFEQTAIAERTAQVRWLGSLSLPA